MGYTLKIGELDIEFDQDEDYPAIFLSAKLVSHPDAPAYGEPTDYENQRWPSYTSWSEFCKKAEIYNLFLIKLEVFMLQDCLLVRENY